MVSCRRGDLWSPASAARLARRRTMKVGVSIDGNERQRAGEAGQVRACAPVSRSPSPRACPAGLYKGRPAPYTHSFPHFSCVREMGPSGARPPVPAEGGTMPQGKGSFCDARGHRGRPQVAPTRAAMVTGRIVSAPTGAAFDGTWVDEYIDPLQSTPGIRPVTTETGGEQP